MHSRQREDKYTVPRQDFARVAGVKQDAGRMEEMSSRGRLGQLRKKKKRTGAEVRMMLVHGEGNI